ncbi:DUF2249 domain-containing protein [Sulfurimonas sp. HSL1-2]|uniref:DUF2249 domain-containing protein n=1 Tax=Thiomicrolovo zhangzhouensis TaxID=3131933 RepID=UPI0031F9B99F
MHVIELDVRIFEHPVPLEKAIAAFAALTQGEVLHMIHRKNPLPLFDILGKQGGRYRSYEDENGIWHILIARDPAVDLESLDV